MSEKTRPPARRTGLHTAGPPSPAEHKNKTPQNEIHRSAAFSWSWWPDLNRRPADYELWLLGVVSLNILQ